MTACVNRKHTKKVAAVVTASLVGALSLGAAPVAAVADTGIELQDAATPQEIWDASTFEWSAEANAYGAYTVEPGDVFSLESVTDVYGNAVSAGDYEVVYFDGNSPVAAANAINQQIGGMPSGTGTSYTVAVVKTDGAALTINASTTLTGLQAAMPVHTQAFSVAATSKTLEGAYVYEVNASDADDTSDTSFTYTGNPISYKFADADGNEILASNYDLQWLTDAPTTDAGTYTALLTGKGAYAGSQATVSFTVNKLDLSKVTISVDTVDTATGLNFTNTNELNYNAILVDGQHIASGVLENKLVSTTSNTGVVSGNPNFAAGQLSGPQYQGTYLFSVSKASSNPNVTGQPVTVTAYIVAETADVYYDEVAVASYFGSGREFETSKNEAFDPSLVYAEVNGDEVTVNVKVTKDGQEVTSYTEPGEYKVTFEVPTPPSCDYGYKKTFTFRVVSKTINASSVMVFASVDGKAANTASGFPYTGEAYTPDVVVKAGKKVLTEGEDYTVSYRIQGEKDAIDSMVEPETYEIVVSFPGAGINDETVAFTINKAQIKSVKTASPVYAYTGEAVKPDFLGYTSADGSGNAVEFKNSEVGVKYIKAVLNTHGTADTADDTYELPGTIAYISASNLKDEGVYFAEVTVNTNNDHYTGGTAGANNGVTFETFQISKKSGFADVNASAWYAGAVYQAKELGYVNGLSGTNLFAPEADITRADAVCILFNMAGGQVGSNDFQYNENTGYNTGFSDVDGHAYFAKALAWAHASGVANGSNGEFRPYDQITREEFASLLANFAKSKGEYVAADESALDGMSDASSVSDWAKENVAWAVSNKVMGNGGFIAAQDNIIRAEVAAMAVNYQPEAL